MANAIILVSCPDQKGITAEITNFIYRSNGNIEHADQHIDKETNTFFMRIEWSLDGFVLNRESISIEFSKVAKKFSMSWNLYFSDYTPNVAIFVSKHLHCLEDLLIRHKYQEFHCNIPLIISNHPCAQDIAKSFNIKFKEFYIDKSNKQIQEKNQLGLLQQEKIDLIVLARYTQIFTKSFVSHFPNKIINIHHSFLPAFPGKKPYHRAFDKGVKIIGATSHYVIEELDCGPIIEQNTVRTSHRDSLNDLIQKGKDLEKSVFNKAVKLHLQRKILVYNNKTVIFD